MFNSEISSKKHISIGLILLASLLFSAGVLAFGYFYPVEISAREEKFAPPQWTEKTGEGISAPACSSATAFSYCVSNDVRVDLGWSYGGQHGPCTNGLTELYITGVGTWGGYPCSGATWVGGLAKNTTYTGGVRYYYDPPPYQACGEGTCAWCGLPCTNKSGNCQCMGTVDPPSFVIDSNTFSFTTPVECSTCLGTVDMGLRFNDGTGTYAAAIDPAGVYTSALHMRFPRDNLTHTVKLTVLTDNRVSKFRVWTNTGIYGICKY